jgi:hypothetical protein
MARTKTSFLTRGLDKLKGVFAHAPSDPAPRALAKKAARPKPPPAAGAQAASPDATATPDPKAPHKKKIPAQPWYRHRQRW